MRRLATWLVLMFFTCQRAVEGAQIPSIVEVGATLPTSTSESNFVMQSGGSGYFTVHVKTWEATIRAGYMCMAVVKHMKIVPGSTMWAANLAQPVFHPCQLKLNPDGLYLINAENGTTIWKTQKLVGVATMTMQDDGNLVIRNAANDVLWQTFDEPIIFDILPGMKFTVGMTLYSADVNPDMLNVTDFNVAPSNYGMRMEPSGRIYIFIALGAPRIDISDAGFTHWGFNSFGTVPPTTPVAYILLDQHPASFRFYDKTMKVIVGSKPLPDPTTLLPVINYTPEDRKVAFLSPNVGNLATWDFASTGVQGKFGWRLLFDSSERSERRKCERNPRRCGSLSLCHTVSGACFCYEQDFVKNNFGDCVIRDKKRNYNFARVTNVSFHPQLPPIPKVNSESQCESNCWENQGCMAALYDQESSTCALFSNIRAVAYDPYPNLKGQVLFLRVNLKMDVTVNVDENVDIVNVALNIRYIVVIVVTAVVVILALICCCCCCKCPFLLGAWRRRKYDSDEEEEEKSTNDSEPQEVNSNSNSFTRQSNSSNRPSNSSTRPSNSSTRTSNSSTRTSNSGRPTNSSQPRLSRN